MKDCSKVLFITDMDGTLLPPDKKLNPADLEAISRFRQAGGRFSVATGRSVQSAAQYFEGLALDEPVIVCNGGGIYDCKKCKFAWEKFVDPSAYDIVKSVYDRFPSVGIEINMSDRILVPRLNRLEQYHLDISYGGKYTSGDIDSLPREDWCKALFAAEQEEIPALMEFISSLGNDKSVYVRSSPIFYEILPKDCTKGYALEKLKEIYGLDGWTIVACGDYDNDLKMLEYADFAVSPSNGQDCVKAASDLVTDADCGSGAIAEAIYHVMNVL